jgi:hypothetical protein
MSVIDLDALNLLLGFNAAPYLTLPLNNILGSEELEYWKLDIPNRQRIFEELEDKLKADTQKIGSPQKEEKELLALATTLGWSRSTHFCKTTFWIQRSGISGRASNSNHFVD